MILPECDACGSDEACLLVSFAMTPADHEWAARDVDGHPPWQAWFCREHAVVAQKFANLPRDEARVGIMKNINTSTE